MNDLLRRAYKEFDSSAMEEEYDFQGLCEFYGKGFLEKLNRYLTATGSERADIESDILLNAKKAAKGKSPKANERVEKLTQQDHHPYLFYAPVYSEFSEDGICVANTWQRESGGAEQGKDGQVYPRFADKASFRRDDRRL